MATLNFKILPTRRKANGKLGIYLAVTHKKQVRYISTEFEIDDEAEFENGKVCYRKDADKINKRLAYVLSEYKEKLSKIHVNSYVSCSALKDALMTKEVSENITLSEMFSQRIKRLEDEGRKKYAWMNQQSFQRIMSVLTDVQVIYISRNDIRILEKEFIRLGYSNATIQIYMSHLKAAINELINTDVIDIKSPFRGYIMPSSPARLLDITKEEFADLLNFENADKRIQISKDMWLLSFYLGGINMEDLSKIDLRNDSIRYIRSKTKNKKKGNKETVLSIPFEAREIISRYINDEGKLQIKTTPSFLPFIDRNLKKIAVGIGINPDRLCYYSARKTFAQFAFELGVRTEVIEYCLGQSMKNNRPVYSYVRVMQKYADEAIRKVIDYAHGRISISNN